MQTLYESINWMWQFELILEFWIFILFFIQLYIEYYINLFIDSEV